jgi:uncharacterized membrane protein
MNESAFANPLFIVNGLTALIFIVGGFILVKYPPKKINQLYGYRTESSMKNQARWDFAQKYAAQQMKLYGFILGLIALAGPFLPLPELVGVGLALVCVIGGSILLILSVERGIKNNFPAD